MNRHPHRLRRITMACALAISACAIGVLGAREPMPTSGATAQSSGWFDGLQNTKDAKARPATLPTGKSIDEPALFNRLYPELARMDKAIRAQTPRVVFDGLSSSNKPRLKLPLMSVTGFVFTEASEKAYAARGRRDPFLQQIDERKVRIATIEAQRAGASLCLDIETFPLDARLSPPADIDRSVQEIAKAAGYARSQNPNLRLFFYSGFPAGEYYAGGQVAGAATTQPEGSMYGWWKANTPDFLARYETWSQANAVLRPDAASDNAAGARRPASALATLFDGVCPSLYLIDEPTARGQTANIAPFVRSNVDEARRYGKPVYPFVCFYLIETKNLVPLNQWTLLIREIVTYADGVVLWDGPNPWSEQKTLRTRIAVLLAERKGEISDEELYAMLRKELPGDPELQAMAAQLPAPQQSRTAAR